jgi:hypothetical protein
MPQSITTRTFSSTTFLQLITTMPPYGTWYVFIWGIRLLSFIYILIITYVPYTYLCEANKKQNKTRPIAAVHGHIEYLQEFSSQFYQFLGISNRVSLGASLLLGLGACLANDVKHFCDRGPRKLVSQCNEGLPLIDKSLDEVTPSFNEPAVRARLQTVKTG